MEETTKAERKLLPKAIKVSGRAYNNIQFAIDEIGGEPRHSIQRIIDLCLDEALHKVIAEQRSKAPKLRFIPEPGVIPDSEIDFKSEPEREAGVRNGVTTTPKQRRKVQRKREWQKSDG